MNSRRIAASCCVVTGRPGFGTACDGRHWCFHLVPSAALNSSVAPPIERTAKGGGSSPAGSQGATQLRQSLARSGGALRKQSANMNSRSAAILRWRKRNFISGWLGEIWEIWIRPRNTTSAPLRSTRKMANASQTWPVFFWLRVSGPRRVAGEHSIILNPLLQIAHKELGDILCGTREYQVAIAHYEQALRIQPDFAEAKQNLSFARTLAGR